MVPLCALLLRWGCSSAIPLQTSTVYTDAVRQRRAPAPRCAYAVPVNRTAPIFATPKQQHSVVVMKSQRYGFFAFLGTPQREEYRSDSGLVWSRPHRLEPKAVFFAPARFGPSLGRLAGPERFEAGRLTPALRSPKRAMTTGNTAWRGNKPLGDRNMLKLPSAVWVFCSALLAKYGSINRSSLWLSARFCTPLGVLQIGFRP
jgi:hypothetical protein